MNPDTDGDNASDGDEVFAGTIPTNPASRLCITMLEQMPDMMPKVMDNLMPHMLGDLVPLVTEPMLDYLKGKNGHNN